MYPSELTNAYNVLRNLTSRREYDKEIGTYFIMRSTKKKQNEEKVLRLTDEMQEIDMKGIRQVLYLRNRKHVQCFYRVIEKRVEVWENEKCAGKCFHSFFEFSQTFVSVSITQ